MNSSASQEPQMRERGGSTPNPQSILVAIPTLNEEAHIADTLRDLMANHPEMTDVKIVIADGGSTDRTCLIVEELTKTHPNLHLLHNPERRQAAAINLIVEQAADEQHKIMVRIDAHARYPAGYVLDVAAALKARQADGLATVMDSGGPSCFQRGSAWAIDSKLGSGGSAHRGGTTSDWVDHGHHAGFKLQTFRDVGGYDTRLTANEDAELDHRIGLAGGRIWLEASIRLGYVMRPHLRGLAVQYWRYGEGRAQTVKKHRLRPRLRQMFSPVAVITNGLSILLSPFFVYTLAIPALYLAILLGSTVQITLRNRSLCGLWAFPTLMAVHHAWGAGFLRELFSGRKP